MTQRVDLSIVLPIRNDPASRALVALSSTLKELCRDTSLAVELIVVDDASSDATVTFAGEVLQGLGNAKLVELKTNGGPGVARNVGLGLAEGEFVTFVDADDDLDLGVLLQGVTLARRTTADVVAFGYQERGESGLPAVMMPESGASLCSLLTRRAAVWRFIFRSEFLASSGIRFPKLFYAEDIVFALRVAEARPRVESLQKCAYTYFLHPSGLSGSAPAPKRAEIALQELLHLESSSSSPEVESLARAWAARIAFRSRRGLLRTNPRLLARVMALMVANPKDAGLLTTSVRQARGRRASK
jgi:glycosyltransferase involved in cell wall biosynthesis